MTRQGITFQRIFPSCILKVLDIIILSVPQTITVNEQSLTDYDNLETL